MLLVDDRHAPVDLKSGSAPVLRWRDDAADAGVVSGNALAGDPVAYRIAVAATREDAAAGNATVWDSGWTDGDLWGGAALDGVEMAPARRYWGALQWRYADGTESDWCEPTTFGTAPAGDAWQAASVWGPESDADTAHDGSAAHDVDAANADGDPAAADAPAQPGNSAGWAVLRGTFNLPDKPIRWATLTATASSTRPARQFVYRMWLNGAFVGCGPTFPIGDEARLDGYDVTDLLRAGDTNAIGVIAYTMEDRRFAAQLDVCFADGSTERFVSDAGWKTLPDPAAVWPDGDSIGTQYFAAPAENIRGDAFPYGFADPDFDDGDWADATVKPDFDRVEPAPTDKLQLEYLPAQSLRVIDRTSPDHPGERSVVADFGAGYMGGIRLDLTPGEPVDVTVRYGETLNEDGSVRYRMSTGNVYEERWHLVPGGRPLETWGLRVFRYVEIAVAQPPVAPASWDEPSPTGIDEEAAVIADLLTRPLAISAAVLVYPSIDGRTVTDGGYVGRFSSSDPQLDAVWQLSAHTIAAFNGNIYADSWTRERAPYEADAWIQQRAHLALDSAPSLGRYTVDYLIANRTWPTEWPLYLILAVHEAWMRTGSAAQAAEQYERLQALLPDQYLDDETGFIVKQPGESSRTDGDLVDWPPSERDGFVFGQVNTVINALAAEAYADMAGIADLLGHTDDAARYAAVAARLRDAINEHLYDAVRGAYIDGLTVTTTQDETATVEFAAVGSRRRASTAETTAAETAADAANDAHDANDGNTADDSAGETAVADAAGTPAAAEPDDTTMDNLPATIAGDAPVDETDDPAETDDRNGAEPEQTDQPAPPQPFTVGDRTFTPIDHAAMHSSAFALTFAHVPADRVPRVGDTLRDKGMACSVYTAVPYLTGLYRAGLGADAAKLYADRRTTHSWLYMIAQGAGGTMEAWALANKPNTTYSHPWAASPVFLIAEGLMGVRPIEPGYRRFAVVPQLGDMRAATLTLPTPAGDIALDYSPTDGERDGITIDLTVPARTQADVVLPAVKAGASPVIMLDGSLANCELVTEPADAAGVLVPAGSVRLRGLKPGLHQIIAVG
ncbi:family 78 glycoside hydrolase catalytic domain [Bifidobacterium sp. 82T10]|uniref:Family 78 glycoside hydrolase catalytic domain n=1 Tax=Bifidobacterium miconis TaxID=2834435 RepID=A0ABS6WJJ6_9BIFI|nr:family 78 glycoside hydrolase catalytic domain [Bifidobacterium miconis]MBW3093396.1 family 78 glycoside hydrolase catalytic domain [Bifidobacterium miconis]